MSSKFSVVRQLGAGSFGTVKEVIRKTDQLHYAMKIINVAKLNQRDRNDQLNELRIIASLYHTNILAYYESFIEDRNLYVITEMADQGDLSTEIQNRQILMTPFMESEIWSMLLQVLSGLRKLHSCGILHRDIKGQNILRFSNAKAPKKPVYKLADFGASKVLQSAEDLAKTGIGTPYYVCPEIWQRKQYNEKADIFSLGILLYEMMALKRPYDGATAKELNANVLKGQYPLLPPVYSKSLRNICYLMMSNDPDRRPTVQEILMQPFAEQHFIDSPVPIEESAFGDATVQLAGVQWNDQGVLSTIKLTRELNEAMDGGLRTKQSASAKSYIKKEGKEEEEEWKKESFLINDKEAVGRQLPKEEYEERKQFEMLQKAHQERIVKPPLMKKVPSQANINEQSKVERQLQKESEIVQQRVEVQRIDVPKKKQVQKSGESEYKPSSVHSERRGFLKE